MKTPVHLVKSEKLNRRILKLGGSIHWFTNTCLTCGHVWTSETESVDCPNTLIRPNPRPRARYQYKSTGAHPDPEGDPDEMTDEMREKIGKYFRNNLDEIVKKLYTDPGYNPFTPRTDPQNSRDK